MLIDTQVFITRVPQASWLVGEFAQVWDGIRDFIQDRDLPTFVEVLILVGFGFLVGFMVIAYSFQAIVVAFVMAVGSTWGMVLGLLVDRLYQSQL